MKDNINISGAALLTPPDILKRYLPLSELAEETVNLGRNTIKEILSGADTRLLVVVGPCSIHDTEAALDYAKKLVKLKKELAGSLYLVMRVYFEKPRTTVGWKGLINDPYLDDSFCVEEGLRSARQLLLDISELGLPIATEVLDPVSPQYLQDLISWSAIGARTTESQTHREIASGLSSIVGFKNGTDGGIDVALNAIKSASSPHHFLGMNDTGNISVIATKGNSDSHIVLRGGNKGPNYSAKDINVCEEILLNTGLHPNIMVDVSHENSNKKPENQPLILEDITMQIIDGNESIFGIMIESNLNPGNQKVENGTHELDYGVSITDACIGWEDTVYSLRKMGNDLHDVLRCRKSNIESTKKVLSLQNLNKMHVSKESLYATEVN